MNNVIQQLKDNEKPFGLMSEEMQEKAKEIEVANFLRWLCRDSWSTPKDHIFLGGSVYRLRPDYEEKPLIVECEITEEEWHLHFRLPDSAMRHSVHQACDHPDFIGFKAYGWIWGKAYKNKRTGIINIMIRVDQLDDYEVVNMTDAYVLFRGPQ